MPKKDIDVARMVDGSRRNIKAMMIRSLIIAFDRVVLGRIQYIVVAESTMTLCAPQSIKA